MTRLKKSVCPWCEKRHDLVSGIAEKGTKKEPIPHNGDVTLCVGCGELSVFDDSAKGGLRFPTQEEVKAIEDSHLATRVRQTFESIPQPNRRTILHIPPWMKSST